MIIDCSKCSIKFDCKCWEKHNFSECWKLKNIVKERRNMIAIEAMKAMLSNPSLVIGGKNDTPSSIARVSVMVADEIMKLLK